MKVVDPLGAVRERVIWASIPTRQRLSKAVLLGEGVLILLTDTEEIDVSVWRKLSQFDHRGLVVGVNPFHFTAQGSEPRYARTVLCRHIWNPGRLTQVTNSRRVARLLAPVCVVCRGGNRRAEMHRLADVLHLPPHTLVIDVPTSGWWWANWHKVIPLEAPVIA